MSIQVNRHTAEMEMNIMLMYVVMNFDFSISCRRFPIATLLFGLFELILTAHADEASNYDLHISHQKIWCLYVLLVIAVIRVSWYGK